MDCRSGPGKCYGIKQNTLKYPLLLFAECVFLCSRHPLHVLSHLSHIATSQGGSVAILLLCNEETAEITRLGSGPGRI